MAHNMRPQWSNLTCPFRYSNDGLVYLETERLELKHHQHITFNFLSVAIRYLRCHRITPDFLYWFSKHAPNNIYSARAKGRSATNRNCSLHLTIRTINLYALIYPWNCGLDQFFKGNHMSMMWYIYIYIRFGAANDNCCSWTQIYMTTNTKIHNKIIIIIIIYGSSSSSHGWSIAWARRRLSFFFTSHKLIYWPLFSQMGCQVLLQSSSFFLFFILIFGCVCGN